VSFYSLKCGETGLAHEEALDDAATPALEIVKVNSV
jgi:hypothetical protein